MSPLTTDNVTNLECRNDLGMEDPLPPIFCGLDQPRPKKEHGGGAGI
jgi:hypothetical protein